MSDHEDYHLRPAMVTAIGLVTSLGHNTVTSCASARAGLIRAGAMRMPEFLEDGSFPEPPRGHAVRGLQEGARGTARLACLGKAALRDLVSQRKPEAKGTAFFLLLPDRGAWIPAADPVAVLPDDDAGPFGPPVPDPDWREECRPLPDRLLRSIGLAVPAALRALAFGGAAEAARLVTEAQEWIRAGKARRCLVGAIDSLLDPDLIQASRETTWRGPDPVSLEWPGEAAAFLLLEAPDALNTREPGSLALTAAVWSQADASRFSVRPPSGRIMGDALIRVIAWDGNTGSSPDWVFTNLCGDAVQTSDFGKALVRLNAAHRLAALPLRQPASDFGDCGAAAGFLWLGLFREAYRRGYAPSALALAGLYSCSGNVGAIRARVRGKG
jgi:3-oxoacyl-[acyl-carrier-protein] synthase-1